MEATIQNGNLVISIPLKEAELSKTGKMFMVASSEGFRETTAQVDGKRIKVNLMAGFKA